jgi:hypothetical protein
MENVDYQALIANAAVLMQFKGLVQYTIAEGYGTTTQNVEVKLSPGSVKIEATVKQTEEESAAQSTVDTSTLSTQLVESVQSVSGIASVATGAIAVNSISVSEAATPVFEWLPLTNFDGSTCLGNAEGSASDLPTTGAYTIEAMIKPSIGGAIGIVGWGTYGYGNKVNAFRMGSASSLVNYWWGNDLEASLGESLVDGSFHHVAATYDGTTRKIFVDYVQQSAGTFSGYSATDKSTFCVGKTYGTEYFKGDMKNIKIWNVARTAEQMQA